MDLSNIPAELKQDAIEIIQRCIVDRLYFVEEVLGVKSIYVDEGGDEYELCHDEIAPESWTLISKGVEDWQVEVLEDMDAGATLISIVSAVGVGKTTLVSWLAVHFVLFREDVKTIVTSPSFNQLRDGIIPEVNKWIGRLPDWLQRQLDTTTERVSRKPDKENNFISFRTARKETPEALQGIHATHVLLLVDEASGVDEVVYEAGSGTMSTEGAITVLIGNPIRVTGLFFKTHRKLKSIWQTYVVNSFMSTRVQKSFPKMMEKTYGIDSQQYKARVLAQFPEGNADSVIPRKWVEQASTRYIVPTGRETRVWGVDPGRGGDPTGFCERRGRGLTALEEWYDDNLMAVVGKVKVRWDELSEGDRPEAVFVDTIGIGAGVADRLTELGLPVIEVNVAEMAAMKDRFVRLRAELWWEMRGFFEQKSCYISADIDPVLVDKLIEELSEPRLKTHSSGKLDVESKDDMKKRGVPSPNMADALGLTLADDASIVNGARGEGSWGKPLKHVFKGAA